MIHSDWYKCGKSWIIDLTFATLHVGLTSNACKVWKWLSWSVYFFWITLYTLMVVLFQPMADYFTAQGFSHYKTFFYFFDGVRHCICGTGSLMDLLSIPQMTYNWVRAEVGWYWQGKLEGLGKEPVPVPLCSPQTPRGLTGALTRSSAVRSRR
jgi:hypothetical protein